MYQITYTKSGRKRGAKTLAEVESVLTSCLYSRTKAQSFKSETGELIGECRCINADKDYWRVTINSNVICESRALRLSWLEDIAKLKGRNVFVLNRPAYEVRVILKRKHPGVYEVEHLESGKCMIHLAKK